MQPYDSAMKWVDEIIVVDTGSTDATPDICRRLGAKVFQFPWCDDFSAARNESLRHASGKWIFWMDSDDTIDEVNGQNLRDLVSRNHPPNVMGYVMQVHCPSHGEEGLHDVTMVDHVKLFRNHPKIRFEGRIHEQILQPIRALNGDVVFTDIFVTHSGSDNSPEGRIRKRKRDLAILAKDLEERPEHPFVLFNLGMTYFDAQEFGKAIGFIERSLSRASPTESHVRKAYAFLVGAYCQLNRFEEARSIVEKALVLLPNDAELTFRQAIIHQHFGWLRQAESCYLKLLEPKGERHFDSVDIGIHSFKTRHNLARVYDEMGAVDKAIEQWHKITVESPFYWIGWRGLVDCLVTHSRLDEAEQVVVRIKDLKHPPHHYLRMEAVIAEARIHIVRGEMTSARSLLESGIKEFPKGVDLLRELSRLLFEHFDPAEACDAQERLVRMTPDDPSALHNLGTNYCRLERWKDALAPLEKASNLRPTFQPTIDLLGVARATSRRPCQRPVKNDLECSMNSPRKGQTDVGS